MISGRLRRGLQHFLLAFGVLLLSTPLAAAAGPPVCGGRSLVEKAQVETPKEYQSIVDAAAKVANGEAVLWRIEKEGVASASWLFGTIHLTDERVRQPPPKAAEALNAATTVAVEIADAAGPGEIGAAFAANPRLIAMPGGQQVYSLLKPEVGQRLRDALLKSGTDPAQAGNLQPWLLATMFTIPRCEAERVQWGIRRLDDGIIESARARGIEVIGLERVPEQLEAVAAMPIEGQAAQLAAILDPAITAEDRQETLVRLYLGRKLAFIFPMLELAEDKAIAEAFRYYSETLIGKRNLTMRDRALPLLAKGGLFIAVGAAHLPGERGLVALLRDAGYKVTPVD